MSEVEIKTCPFMGIRCNPVCLAWFDELDDCMFHLCMTQVEATFYAAAEFMDRKLGLSGGAGEGTLGTLRRTLTGNATADDKQTVRSTLGGILSAGVLDKLSSLTLSDLAEMFSDVDKVLKFDLSSLFASVEEDEEEDAGLVFTQNE